METKSTWHPETELIKTTFSFFFLFSPLSLEPFANSGAHWEIAATLQGNNFYLQKRSYFNIKRVEFKQWFNSSSRRPLSGGPTRGKKSVGLQSPAFTNCYSAHEIVVIVEESSGRAARGAMLAGRTPTAIQAHCPEKTRIHLQPIAANNDAADGNEDNTSSEKHLFFFAGGQIQQPPACRNTRITNSNRTKWKNPTGFNQSTI